MKTEDYQKLFNQDTLDEMHANGERVKNFLNEKYEKEAKMERLEMRLKKWYNQPLIGYLIAFITLIFAFYQGFQNESLKKNISSLEKNAEFLKNEFDTLNKNHDFLEEKFLDFKNNIDLNK